MYDPATGRFLTRDPIGLAPADNPHSYPLNPTAWTDPLGLMPRDVHDTNSTTPRVESPGTTLYRNVDANEFNSIAETGEFTNGPGNMEGKWFAHEGEHAERWGEVLNGGDGLTVQTTIPQWLFDRLHHHPGGKLEGIGPASYADTELMRLINLYGNGINLWL